MTIVNDASTINVFDEASLALANIVNYNHKWSYNLECHLLTTLGASITIVNVYNTGHRLNNLCQTMVDKFYYDNTTILIMTLHITTLLIMTIVIAPNTLPITDFT